MVNRYRVTKGSKINRKGEIVRFILDEKSILIGFKIGNKLIFPPINKFKKTNK